jgi:uncharacterized membrane protein YfcA
MKEMMKQSIRHANIGIAVCAIIAVGGAFLFRHQGEEALQLVGFAAILGAFGVYFTLEERARRKREKRPQ